MLSQTGKHDDNRPRGMPLKELLSHMPAAEAGSLSGQGDEAAGSPKGAEEEGGTAKAKGRFLNRMKNPRPNGIRTKIKETIKHTRLGDL